MLLDMLQAAPPPCHLVSDLLAGLQPGLVQGLLLQESLCVVVAGGVAAVEATLQVSPAMASMVRRTFRTSAASGCGIPRCVPSYQRRGLHSRAARQSQTGTSRNRRHEVIVEVPPRVGSWHRRGPWTPFSSRRAFGWVCARITIFTGVLRLSRRRTGHLNLRLRRKTQASPHSKGRPPNRLAANNSKPGGPPSSAPPKGSGRST